MPIDPRRYDIPKPITRAGWLLFRLEHRLLSPGSSGVAVARGYLRLRAWRACTTLRERLLLIATAIKLPARAIRGSLAAVRQHGSIIEERHGVPRGRQFRDLLFLWLRHGIHPDIYYFYHLYEGDRLSRAPYFFQEGDEKIYRLVNLHTAPEEADLVGDKVGFEDWLTNHDLPTVRTVLILKDGSVQEWTDSDGRLPRCSLFSKPNDSIRGLGTARWTFDGLTWSGDDERRLDEAGLLAELREQSRSRTLIVQRQLRNHPALEPIAPGALSTIRVVTLRALDGRILPIYTVCKIPIGASRTDNMAMGNAAAPIDLITGELGVAIRRPRPESVERCERHPDTGVLFEGFKLPYWDQTVSLAVRAHQSLTRLVYVGWDIAILDSGPVIVEANDNPGHYLNQLPTGLPIGETPVVATLVAHLTAVFGARRAHVPG